METKEKEKSLEERRSDYVKAVVVDPKQMKGVWEVSIEITNSQGIKAFGGRFLTEYAHPLTGKTCKLFNVNGEPELGLHLAQKTTQFFPDTNANDRLIVDWMLVHPEVGVQGISLTEKALNKKISNPTITMKNIDRQEMTVLEDEDRIDTVIGRLSDVSSTKGLSLKKLRYLLAYFNLPYYDLRYVTSKATETQFLRKKIKTFARIPDKDSKGLMNCDKIEAVLNEIDDLKYNYEFKEMLRFKIITESYGSYKFNNVPLGSTEEIVITFAKQNLDVYAELVGLLYPLLKDNGFS